jgi:NAD(P)-dependent dehydrogenase (short-subunit alcohol dehydrogenase family)
MADQKVPNTKSKSKVKVANTEQQPLLARPALESEMTDKPVSENQHYKGSGKLEGKVALITGGDSGIGKAVAIAFAKEGADVAILYLNEHEDAKQTVAEVEQEGRRCLAMAGDIGKENFCKRAVEKVVQKFGGLDILVNNAAEQHTQQRLEDISSEQLEKTFRTNIFSQFYLAKAALPHLSEGSTIINTTSVTAYRGSESLLDYASTKGAIVAFTRSLALNLAERGIRVNGVAPGPIWTPLIPSTMPKEKVAKFGQDTPLKRPGQPEEVAPSYVFLASDDASYFTGQILHPNGGEVVNA